jgi:pSer/pThr/pTyr-binding forkhead associated (FHA) protein
MRAKLLIVAGRPQGQALYFPCGEFVIGRGEECHLRPNSSWVSRQHCMLRVEQNIVHLRDLGSRNGTLVNGARIIGERRLIHGDRVQLGPLVLQLCLEDSTIDFAMPRPAETGVRCAELAEKDCLNDGMVGTAGMPSANAG